MVSYIQHQRHEQQKKKIDKIRLRRYLKLLYIKGYCQESEKTTSRIWENVAIPVSDKELMTRIQRTLTT